MPDWYVYVLRCSDGTLYTGVTTDPARRVDEHNGVRGNGARYTRARRPVCLVYQEPRATRAQAARRESEIKRLKRKEKERLVSAGSGAHSRKSSV